MLTKPVVANAEFCLKKTSEQQREGKYVEEKESLGTVRFCRASGL